MENKVIVFGGDHHNTLGVIRSLGEKGIKPYVYISSKDVKSSFVLKSRYIEKGWMFKSEEECLQDIVRNFESPQNKSIIICTSDAAASHIDLNFDSLSQNFFIPNCGKQGEMTRLMNKEMMNDIAELEGLNVARTWHTYLNDIQSEVEYPCITKPLESIAGSKSDIQICNNYQELNNYLAKNRQKCKLLIQKYIEKDFEFQLIGCSLNGGENVIMPGYTQIIRSSETTNTGFLKYLPIDSINLEKEKCIKFIQACNYSGLFSLEFIRDKDGKDFFLEINFRNDGNAYSVTAAGINLPYIWVTYLLNEDISKEMNNSIKPTVVMPELVDVYQIFMGKVTLRNWIEDLKMTDCFLYYHKYDKKPFYFVLGSMLGHLTMKIPQKLFNKLFK